MHKSVDSLSESIAKPDRRFGAVSYTIGAHRRRQVEGRAVIDESAIFDTSEKTMGDVKVGASAVDERCSSLRGCCGVIRGIEDQSTHARLYKWREVSHCVAIDIGGGDFMLVRF